MGWTRVALAATLVTATAIADETVAPTQQTLTVAVVSSESQFCDVVANLAHFEELIIEAARRGARLVCFPETALTGCAARPEVRALAEEAPGPSTDRLAEIAASQKVYISMGMPEKDGEKYYTTQVLVGPAGYIGKYRKNRPTAGETTAGFSPGETFPVFDVDGFRVGVNICFDGRSPETIAPYAGGKVDAILHPHGNATIFGKNGEEWTRGKMAYLVARALIARAYLLVNNSAGDLELPEMKVPFAGGALVIDPLGQVIARTTEETRDERIIYATLRKPLTELIPLGELKALGITP